MSFAIMDFIWHERKSYFKSNLYNNIRNNLNVVKNFKIRKIMLN